MEHIDQTAIIGYEVPLRIALKTDGEVVRERNVRERHYHALGQCDSSETCELRYLHQRMRGTRITRPKGDEPSVRYAFGIVPQFLDVRVLVAPKRYEVLVVDTQTYCATCHGVLFHDQHATREPIDLERVVATLDKNVLLLRLPRVRPVPASALTIGDWPGPNDLDK